MLKIAWIFAYTLPTFFCSWILFLCQNMQLLHNILYNTHLILVLVLSLNIDISLVILVVWSTLSIRFLRKSSWEQYSLHFCHVNSSLYTHNSVWLVYQLSVETNAQLSNWKWFILRTVGQEFRQGSTAPCGVSPGITHCCIQLTRLVWMVPEGFTLIYGTSVLPYLSALCD